MANLIGNTLDAHIIRLVKALYDAAPGHYYLTNLRGTVGGENAISAQLNANFAHLSNAQWAALVANNLHLTGQASTSAQNYLLAQLAGGFTRGQTLLSAVTGLTSLENDATFGAAAAYFNASNAVALEYSLNPANSTTNLAVLQLADEPNTAPVAVNDTAAATEGGNVIAGSVATNDSDAEGNPLTFSLAVTQAPVPGLTFNSNGSFTFDPSNSAYNSLKAGATQAVAVAYTVSDGKLSSNATLTITVTGTNDAPTAQAVVASGLEDAAGIEVTPVSTDPDSGDTAAYSVAAQPLNGSVSFNAGTGKFVYVPNANFNGADSFVYRVTDGSGATSTATATVNVQAVNDAPVANALTVFGTEDVVLGGTVTGSDIEGSPLTYAVVTGPSKGSLVLNTNGSFIYTPNPNSNGADSFTFTANDGQLTSAPKTVTINIAAVNDAPVAQNVFATGLEDAAVISVTPASTDVDTGDTATYSLVTGTANGSVVFNAVSGKFDYTPAANFFGTDSFVYRVTDSGGLSSTAVGTVTVQAVNDAPVANASTASGLEDTAIGGTVTGSDTEGSALTFAVVTGPAKGSVVMNTNGSYVYTPNANFNGSDSFTFRANDGQANSAPQTVTITVAPANDAPVAHAVFATGAEDAPSILVTPESHDIDVGDTATYSVNSQPANGTVTFNAGTGKFVYVPNLNFNGVDTFTYRVTDSGGLSSVAVATVTVQAVNDAPVAIASSASGNENTAITGTVTGTDVDGDTLTYNVATQGANGTVAINNATGDYVYTPNPGYVGADSFQFMVNDGQGGTSVATVSLTVIDVANILTVGNDNVALSGTGGQAVIGNHLTYNAGDNIAGSAGPDTLTLGLTPSTPVLLGSATVTGIETFNVNVNPVTATDTVTLEMTNVDGALGNVNINRSTGHDISITDLQNLPRITIDDVGAMVTVNVDNQVVAGNADALPISVREFGTGSSSTFGRSILVVDNAIETLNITDMATSAGFNTDIRRISNNADAGAGYTRVNIDGGAAGTTLTIQDFDAPGGVEAGGFTGSANPALVTIDSTAYLGRLVADIDGAGAGIVRTGVGNDVLTAHEHVTGTVTTGDGNDTVLLHTASLLGNGSISTGTGNDTVTVQGDVGDGVFSAVINGDDGNDTISVTGVLRAGSTVNGGNGNDNIAVTGNIAGTINGGSGGDTITGGTGVATTGVVNGGDDGDNIAITGLVVGTINGDGGNDTITVTGTLGDNTLFGVRGVINGGDGDDTITQNGDMQEGSQVNGGNGNDTINVNGNLQANLTLDIFDGQPAAQINGGAGNDNLTIAGLVDGDIDMGDGDDTVLVVDNNINQGSVQLGNDNDAITIRNGHFLGDGEAGDGLSNDGSIDGGTGANTMTMRSLIVADTGTLNVVSDGSGTAPRNLAKNDATDIANIQTLNLDLDPIVTVPIDTLSNAIFNVDLDAFDATLATINVNDRDGVATANLTGYNSEQINVDSNGTNGAGGDVNLNINSTRDSGTLKTLNVALNGNAAYTTNITDADNVVVSAAGTTGNINLVNLAVNDTGARTVNFDGTDADNNGANAGEGNTLNVSGTNTAALRLNNVTQETINTSGYAGPVTIVIANDDSVGADADPANDNEPLTITTGAGNDVVDMTLDVLDLNDTINLGGGTNRLIVNEGTRLLSLVDEDQVFKNIQNTQELELRGDDATNGATPLLVSIEDDTRNAGVRKIIATNDFTNGVNTAGNVDLDIDADYNDGSAGLRLTVEARSGVVDIDNGANVDLSVDLYANSRNSSGTGTASGSGVTFTQTGSGATNVDVSVAINQAGATTISAATLAGPLTANPATVGHVQMNVVAGAIDSLRITEAGGRADAGQINLTWADNWAQGGIFTIDATDVTNDDFNIPLGFPNTHTGGMRLIAVAEDDLNMTVLATANDDTVWGTQRSDVIRGFSGNDWIQADPAIGSVVAPGVQMVKTVDFNEGNDVDAGDTYSVTVGGRTYTWTAALDSDTVTMAGNALATVINGGADAQVTATGNIDDGNNTDDVSASYNAATGVLTVTGTGVDATFGYALGENHAVTGASRDRAVAQVTVANEGYDIGDVVTINVNGTLYSATVGIGSDASSLAAALAAAVNGGAIPALSATASGAVVSIYSTSALTSYTVTPSWTTDQLTTAATKTTATVTYSAPGAGDFVSATFTGGITVSAATVAALAAAINGNGTLASQWDASAVGNVLTLAADVAGAAAPANNFASAAFIGSGTASWSTVAGTNAVTRTDNTDPTLAARAISFTLGDAWYDGGDTITVSINGAPVAVTLAPPLAPPSEADTDYTGAQAAAAFVAGAALPPGYTATAAGNVVTVTAPDNVAYPTWSVNVGDHPVLVVQPEIVNVAYAAFVNAAADGLNASMTIGATTYTGDTLALLATAVNGGTGTHGYTAAVSGSNILLTGPGNGVEPTNSVDSGGISGSFQTNGGAAAAVVGTNALAVPEVRTLDFAGITDNDGASATFGATTYSTLDVGTALQSLTALQNAINAGTGTHGWTASGATATTITITGPSNGANPAAPTIAILPNGGDITAGAVTAGVAAVTQKFTVTAADFDQPTDSVSVTFDLDNSGTATPGDLSLSGNSWAALAATINANLGSFGGQITNASVVGSSVVIEGPADGSASTTPVVQALFAGTGGPAAFATAAGSLATAWTQTVNVVELDAGGETATVTFTSGAPVTQLFGVDEATSLTNLGNAIAASLGVGFTAVGNAGANTIVLTGPANGANPSKSVAGGDILGAAVAGAVNLVTAGVAADPYDVVIDFSNLDQPGELARVVLAGGTTYEATTLGALVTAINAGTGTHGWTASLAGTNLTLTGPANGTAPAIAFASAQLVAANAAAASETQESWHNMDNTVPVMQVTSGNANTNPALATPTAAVAAATAGQNGNDSVEGGDGNDTIFGMGGNDTLKGEAGNDSLIGGDGNDSIDGGDGNDWIQGDDGTDVLNGGAGNDTVFGGNGNDVINGNDNDDRLFGGAGNDTIDGGNGNDFVFGGVGRDMLTGGAGNDTFYFAQGDSAGAPGFADVVTDYVVGQDTFQFNFTINFYANVTNGTALVAGLTDNLTAIPHAGRTIYDSVAKLLYIDVDGDGAISATNDIVIDLTLTGVAGMSQADFLAPIAPPVA